MKRKVFILILFLFNIHLFDNSQAEDQIPPGVTSQIALGFGSSARAQRYIDEHQAHMTVNRIREDYDRTLHEAWHNINKNSEGEVVSPIDFEDLQFDMLKTMNRLYIDGYLTNADSIRCQGFLMKLKEKLKQGTDITGCFKKDDDGNKQKSSCTQRDIRRVASEFQHASNNCFKRGYALAKATDMQAAAGKVCHFSQTLAEHFHLQRISSNTLPAGVSGFGGSKQFGANCQFNQECHSGYCLYNEIKDDGSLKGTCGPFIYCAKPIAEGRECSTNGKSLCVKDSFCLDEDYNYDEPKLCALAGSSCNKNETCCSGKCNGGECDGKQVCTKCVLDGFKAEEDSKCCPGFQPDEESICRPLFPELVLPTSLENKVKEIKKKEEEEAAKAEAEKTKDASYSPKKLIKNLFELIFWKTAHAKEQKDRDVTKIMSLEDTLADMHATDLDTCEFNAYADEWNRYTKFPNKAYRSAHMNVRTFEMMLNGEGPEDGIILNKEKALSMKARLKEITDKLIKNRQETFKQFAEIDISSRCKCLQVKGLHNFSIGAQNFFNKNCEPYKIQAYDVQVKSEAKGGQRADVTKTLGKQANDDIRKEDVSKRASSLFLEKIMAEYFDAKSKIVVSQGTEIDTINQSFDELLEEYAEFEWLGHDQVDIRKLFTYRLFPNPGEMNRVATNAAMERIYGVTNNSYNPSVIVGTLGSDRYFLKRLSAKGKKYDAHSKRIGYIDWKESTLGVHDYNLFSAEGAEVLAELSPEPGPNPTIWKYISDDYAVSIGEAGSGIAKIGLKNKELIERTFKDKTYKCFRSKGRPYQHLKWMNHIEGKFALANYNSQKNNTTDIEHVDNFLNVTSASKDHLSLFDDIQYCVSDMMRVIKWSRNRKGD